MRLVLLGSALLLCSLTGCESLRTAKSDNPVIGPPPPRVARTGRDHSRNIARASDEESETRLVDADSETDGIRTVSSTVDSSAPFQDDDVIAKVNESPIFARELFESLAPQLAQMNQEVEKLRDTPNYDKARQQQRQIQEKILKGSLPSAIERRMLALAIRGCVKEAQFKQIQEAMEGEYKDHERKMMKRPEFQANSAEEFRKKLREMGYDPVQFKQNKQESFLAQTYFSLKGRQPPEPDRAQKLAYYQEHREEYAFPEQVKWQQIQIRGSRHGGMEKARAKIDQAVDELLAGAPFPNVARKYSDGLTAKEGGQWDWTKRNTLADQQLEDRLFSMPVGEVSPVIRSEETWQVIVVVDRRNAGHKSFEEVQPEIEKKLKAKAQEELVDSIIEDLREDTVVWTVFDDEEQAAAEPDADSLKPLTAQ